ncbi:MAG: NYN domain-containing protein [Rhodobacteraceae bacterium]|nr:NYN domain-containing protein [Paracoccaceae bacterium]
MSNVFVYWDNSNIFHEAQRLADERSGAPGASYRVRIHFDNLLRLAHADRTLKQAFAAGSVPPEMRSLWNRMENLGMEVQLYDRGDPGRGEQEVPDGWLQLRMMENALRNIDTPGIAVLLTGDGADYSEGRGFHTTLEPLHERGWGIEVLSWRHSCK